MKTAEETLKEVSKKLGGGNPCDYGFGKGTWNQFLVVEVAKAYALAAIEEQLKVAAAEARADYPYAGVEEDSILNCTRIELK